VAHVGLKGKNNPEPKVLRTTGLVFTVRKKITTLIRYSEKQLTCKNWSDLSQMLAISIDSVF